MSWPWPKLCQELLALFTNIVYSLISSENSEKKSNEAEDEKKKSQKGEEIR